MSTKKQTQETEALAVKSTAKSEALAVADGYERGDARGKEGIESGDVTLPFLALAQKTSKQIDPSEAKYIADCKFLDLFNSITGELYGPGPLEFIPIVLKKHAIEFNPFNEGGGIRDRNVAWNDERCEFHGDEKPSATRFYDWAVLLLPSMELIVLSFKSTNIAVAKQFQQLVQLRPGPAFAGKYTVKSATGKNQYGTFAKFAIAPAGKPSAEQVEFAQTVYDGLKNANIVVDHEAEPEPGSEQPGAQATTDEAVPF